MQNSGPRHFPAINAVKEEFDNRKTKVFLSLPHLSHEKEEFDDREVFLCLSI